MGFYTLNPEAAPLNCATNSPVASNHILYTQTLYYNNFYTNPTYLIIGYLDSNP